MLCDVSLGDVGEGCGDTDGGFWCSSDGGQENTCKNGILVVKQECARGCIAEWAEDARTYEIVCKS